MRDLTRGKPSVLLLTFALPIFLGNVLQLTYSLVDTRVVGTFLGEDALAAVGATSTVSNLVVGFLMGAANGFAIRTAQRFGAKDARGVRRAFAASLLLGAGISVALTAAGIIFLGPILSFLRVPGELRGMARGYLAIILAGIAVTMAYDVLAASLRALGDTLAPLAILAISVACNIAGDVLFVLVLGTGVWGAAVATVLSQLLAALACLLHLWKRYEILRVDARDFSGFSAGEAGSMLWGGLSMGLMSSLVNIGSLVLQTAINGLGQDIIVAHTAARKISEVFMLMFGVFGQTMATYCGQNAGAGEMGRVRRGIWLAILYTSVWSVGVAIASRVAGERLVWLVTGSANPVVIKNATDYLVFDTTFYIVTAVICVLRNAMQGLGEHVTPLVSSGLEMVGKAVIAPTLVPALGYKGVILAEPIVWFVMVIPLIIRILMMPELRGRERARGRKKP